MNDLKNLLVTIVSGLVRNQNSVSVEIKEDAVKTAFNENTVTCFLKVSPDDMGRVIGKHGKIAKAIRTVMKTAGSVMTPPLHVSVEIDE